MQRYLSHPCKGFGRHFCERCGSRSRVEFTSTQEEFNVDNKSGNTVLRLIAGGVGTKPLLGSENTVPRAPTGDAGARLLLGSSNTD